MDDHDDDLGGLRALLLEVRDDLEKLLWKTGADDSNHAVHDAYKKLDDYVKNREQMMLDYYRRQVAR